MTAAARVKLNPMDSWRAHHRTLRILRILSLQEVAYDPLPNLSATSGNRWYTISSETVIRFLITLAAILILMLPVASVSRTLSPALAMPLVPIALFFSTELTDWIWFNLRLQGKLDRTRRLLFQVTLVFGALVVIGLGAIFYQAYQNPAAMQSGADHLSQKISHLFGPDGGIGSWVEDVNYRMRTGTPVRGPVEGTNWKILTEGTSGNYRIARQKEAADLCVQLGPGWRLPEFLELRHLEPHPASHAGIDVFVQSQGVTQKTAVMIGSKAETTGTQQTSGTYALFKVLCYRPGASP